MTQMGRKQHAELIAVYEYLRKLEVQWLRFGEALDRRLKKLEDVLPDQYTYPGDDPEERPTPRRKST